MHERIYCTRAEYEATFGHIPSEGSIGCCLYSNDGCTLIREYVFAEAKDEIETLEQLYARS